MMGFYCFVLQSTKKRGKVVQPAKPYTTPSKTLGSCPIGPVLRAKIGNLPSIVSMTTRLGQRTINTCSSTNTSQQSSMHINKRHRARVARTQRCLLPADEEHPESSCSSGSNWRLNQSRPTYTSQLLRKARLNNSSDMSQANPSKTSLRLSAAAQSRIPTQELLFHDSLCQ